LLHTGSINGNPPFVNALHAPLVYPSVDMDPRAVPVTSAEIDERGERYAILVDRRPLRTPAGAPVETDSRALAVAIAEELEADGVADVTIPSLYAFYSAEHDFIAPDRGRTVDALVELLAHDYLLHPDERLGIRQAQFAAWQPQADLWRRVAGCEPPYAPPGEEPDILRRQYGAFRSLLAGFSPAQLSAAIHATNLLKSVTLALLLATQQIEPDRALMAATATLRLTAGETNADLEAQEAREEAWREIIARLARYVALART
jgi:chaperone required for assembly of F1-ATPase